MFSTFRQRTIAVYHFLKARRPHLGVFVFVSILFLAGYLSAGIYASNTGHLSIFSPQTVLAADPPATTPASTPAAAASPEVGMLMGWIIGLLLAGASLMLRLAIFCLAFIIQIAGYNGYLSSTAVNVGWVMVRDITNMFFVVILLLVAFGTILGLEQYEWKKMLVKFFLAAVLVNFSRIICGVIIDVGQVVMITFVNGIAATAGGNLINAFSMDKIFSLSQNSSSTTITDTKELFIAAVAAITFSAIILAMMLVFVFMLTARLIVLWILIVLSPFAFVLSVIPQTQKFASQWWSEFGNHVVVGPAVVFFMWLSFAVVGSGQINAEISGSSATPENAKIGDKDSAGIGDVMDWNKMSNFAIAIGILLVGAKTAQSLGTIGGSAMSKATDFGKKVAMVASGASAAMWAGGKAKQGAIASAKWGAMNVPLIGGQSWQRRGLAAKDKLLQGAEWYNKKIGSKVGLGLQFGHHEKMMKERQAAIEVRKGNLSSSVKGYQGWGKEKKPGSVEEYRAYVDNITGMQMVTKEGSEALRTSRKSAAQRETLEQKPELREKYALRTTAQKVEAAKLEQAKSQIELDVVQGDLVKGIAGAPGGGERLVESLYGRDATQKALIAERGGKVEKITQMRTKESSVVEDQAAELVSLENSIKTLTAALDGLAPDGKNASATYNSLPKDLQEKVLGDRKTLEGEERFKKVTGNDLAAREAIIEVVTDSLNKTKEKYEQEKLKFGDVQIGVGGDFGKQLALLEAIQKEIAKENKKSGTGDWAGILKNFEGTIEEVGFDSKLGTKQFDRDFINRNQGRNLESAALALKNMQRQKEAYEKNPLANAAPNLAIAASKSSIELISKQKREISGNINISEVSGSPAKASTLKDIVSKAGLAPGAIDSGLDDRAIEEALRKIKASQTDIDPKLNDLGINMEAIEKMFKELKRGGDPAVQRLVKSML
ncbi:MAG: hypothetical protein WCT11_01680 [Candidatus Magasanikbacteria bacterium]